jgi:hypothetical protein
MAAQYIKTKVPPGMKNIKTRRAKKVSEVIISHAALQQQKIPVIKQHCEDIRQIKYSRDAVYRLDFPDIDEYWDSINERVTPIGVPIAEWCENARIKDLAKCIRKILSGEKGLIRLTRMQRFAVPSVIVEALTPPEKKKTVSHALLSDGVAALKNHCMVKYKYDEETIEVEEALLNCLLISVRDLATRLNITGCAQALSSVKMVKGKAAEVRDQCINNVIPECELALKEWASENKLRVAKPAPRFRIKKDFSCVEDTEAGISYTKLRLNVRTALMVMTKICYGEENKTTSEAIGLKVLEEKEKHGKHGGDTRAVIQWFRDNKSHTYKFYKDLVKQDGDIREGLYWIDPKDVILAD